MTKHLYIFLLVLIGSIISANAQVSLVFLDAKTQQPLEGVAIACYGISETKTTFAITDRSGSISVPVSTPVIIKATHLAYQSLVDTIHFPKTQNFYLVEKTSQLDEIVVTGQYQPQSAKNSVYKVNRISAERIQAQGATSLQDVLTNELNIRFSRDNALGTSSVNLQGLSGQNIKVLIDGVPVIGRSGVSNEIDLNQIDPNSIDRIEIVEGPMAVNFGADALAGTFNIITKKDIEGKIAIDLSIQEETIAKEYSLFSDGIHSYSARVGYNISPNWFAQIESRLNKSGGWTGTGEGRNKNWFPKDQQFTSGVVRFQKHQSSITYRLDWMDETISNLGPIVEIAQKDNYAFDTTYHSNRMMHQLNGEIIMGKLTMHPVVSFSEYERLTNRYKHTLISGNKENTSRQDTISYQTIFFRNTLSNQELSFKESNLQLQVGIDGNIETASGTSLSAGDKHISNLGLFASVEYGWKDKFEVRPGIRLTHNSDYKSIPTPSVNLKYNLTPQSQLRLAYGRGYRAPSLRELYHEFVDTNHNILGNPNLQPERSHNFNIDATTELKKIPLSTSLGAFYNRITNQITYFTPQGTTNQATTYSNLLQYKTTGVSLTSTYKSEKITADIGMVYTGRYQRLSETNDVPQFVFSPEVRANAQYNFKELGISLAGFYKYNGKSKSYQSTTVDGESVPRLFKVEDYHILDMSIAKTWGDGAILRLGLRNALDVTSVNSSQTSDPHGGGGSQKAIAYGRSYFLQLNFHITKS